MLMSDSLGGSAKTLMFVNVSPTDHNIDESSNSLTYATRVRTIKNDISKNEASKDVMRLKRQVSVATVLHCLWPWSNRMEPHLSFRGVCSTKFVAVSLGVDVLHIAEPLLELLRRLHCRCCSGHAGVAVSFRLWGVMLATHCQNTGSNACS